MNSKKRDAISLQFKQHIEAFDEDYQALFHEMEATDKRATYNEEQFRIQSDYLWRAVDLVKEYASFIEMMLADDKLAELPQMVQLPGWKAIRDVLQERASELKKDLSGDDGSRD